MDPWIDKKLDIFFDKTSPNYLNMDIFKEIFAKLDEYEHTKPEVFQYELWRIRDLKNSMDTAKEEGENKKAIEIAKHLLQSGVDIEIIVTSTGLSKEEICKLQQV
jgi:predicted transposase/invertase (TIGR01784 family)